MAVSFAETLSRTARTLRDRFEALRPVGPVPAVMAESPPGEPYPYRGEGAQRLPVFESHDFRKPHWSGGAMVFRDGSHVANRHIWLAGGRAAADRLLLVCHDANGFVPMLRRGFELPSDCGVGDAKQRWLWTVFELAERGVPGSLLSLVKPVFLCDPEGIVHASEDDIRWAKEHPGESKPFSEFFKGDFGPARHWQLADVIEASVMVMDLVELTIGTGTAVEPPAPAYTTSGADVIQAVIFEGLKSALADSKKPGNHRGKSTCELLKDLHVNVDPEFAETAPETALGERIRRSPGTFPDSHYWRTVLQPRRQEVRAEKKKIRRAQKWGHFDSIGRGDDALEPH